MYSLFNERKPHSPLHANGGWGIIVTVFKHILHVVISLYFAVFEWVDGLFKNGIVT